MRYDCRNTIVYRNCFTCKCTYIYYNYIIVRSFYFKFDNNKFNAFSFLTCYIWFSDGACINVPRQT